MKKAVLALVVVVAAGVGIYFAVGAMHNEAPKQESEQVMVGFPADIAEGDTRYIESAQIYIVNDGTGIYSVSAVCTHMGCLLDSKEKEEGFACSCHGSEFDEEGRAKKGPAEAPLEHYAMSYDSELGIIVDKDDATSDETKWKEPPYYLLLSDVSQ
ncbi:MAG: Rieske (2Fe-2S) protein [Planctomycetota bacterium]|nr:Rieske (2Fe-2S) protein [Planctomycetota bacterium]